MATCLAAVRVENRARLDCLIESACRKSCGGQETVAMPYVQMGQEWDWNVALSPWSSFCRVGAPLTLNHWVVRQLTAILRLGNWDLRTGGGHSATWVPYRYARGFNSISAPPHTQDATNQCLFFFVPRIGHRGHLFTFFKLPLAAQNAQHQCRCRQ